MPDDDTSRCPRHCGHLNCEDRCLVDADSPPLPDNDCKTAVMGVEGWVDR